MPSDPFRDRKLAAQPRYAWRKAAGLADALGDLRHSPEFKAMRRFAKVHGCLEECLPAVARGKVRAVQIQGGVLTIEVSDAILCAELRQLSARPILAALAAGGTAVSRIAWRVRSPKSEVRGPRAPRPGSRT